MPPGEVDLVCVGGGLGGLAGALVAAHRGLEVLVVEKTRMIGGVGAYSGGVVWAPCNHLAEADGLADRPDDARAYVEYLSGGRDLNHHDPVMRNALLANVGRVVRLLADLGVRFSVIGMADQYYPSAPGSVATGRAIEAELAREDIGEWASLLRVSPFFPPGRTIREEQRDAGGGPGSVPVLRGGATGAAPGEGHSLPPRLTRGAGLVGSLVRAALIERGVPCLTSTPALELTYDGHRVGGVVVESGGDPVRVTARRGVLLATGSYGSAPWAAAMEGLPAIAEQAPPVLDGDGLTLAEVTPAAVVRAGLPFITLGYRSMSEVHQGSDVALHYPVYQFLGLPHGLVVNRSGARFGDESFYGTFGGFIARYDSATKTFPNYPAYLVLDDEFRTCYGTLSAERGWPANELVRAEGIAQLARRLGVDEAGLESTVARFNDFARRGSDLDFGRGSLAVSREHYGDPRHRPNPNLGEVATPPFWGVRLEILGVGVYSHGLRIDEHARVLTRRGQPIEGLYATGNAVAYGDVPYGYENGLANARNLVYAALAAEHAALGDLARSIPGTSAFVAQGTAGPGDAPRRTASAHGG